MSPRLLVPILTACVLVSLTAISGCARPTPAPEAPKPAPRARHPLRADARTRAGANAATTAACAQTAAVPRGGAVSLARRTVEDCLILDFSENISPTKDTAGNVVPAITTNPNATLALTVGTNFISAAVDPSSLTRPAVNYEIGSTPRLPRRLRRDARPAAATGPFQRARARRCCGPPASHSPPRPTTNSSCGSSSISQSTSKPR